MIRPNNQHLINKALGNVGEQQVVEYLEKQGFVLLGKNFTHRTGEIDSVFQKENLIAFVEVKTRSAKNFLSEGLVGPKKRSRIASAAKSFLLSKKIPLSEYSVRFDVAIVQHQNIKYIENAFYA